MKIKTLRSIFSIQNGLLLWCLLVLSVSSFGQNQKYIDSLNIAYDSGNFKDEDELDILNQLSKDLKNPDKRLLYCNQLIQRAQFYGSIEYQIKGFIEKANTLKQKGDHILSLENYQKAANLASDYNLTRELALSYGSMARVYSVTGNHSSTVKYYLKAIELMTQKKDTNYALDIATTYENLGDEYLTIKNPDSALFYFEKSNPIFKAKGHKKGMAYNLGNKGLAYAQLGLPDKALENINEAITILNEFSDYYAICIYLISLTDIYVEKSDFEKAILFAKKSRSLAMSHGLKPQLSEANLKLSEIYELAGQPLESLKYYKDHIKYRDSIENLSTVQQIADLRTDFEVSQKQAEVDTLSQQKKTQQIIVFLMLAILAITALYYRNISQAKKRSDELLLNILPDKTAEELKQHGKVNAKRFDSVTVMFTDFQAFTKYSQKLSPEILVKSVDYFFSKFDAIIEKYGLEKIKTIGDAYMCAGGLPNVSQDHAVKIIFAAFEIIDFINESKKNSDPDIAHFNIRVGINTGPVVAGVVGQKKFAYDIWGDTVNVASRMESNSIPGRINISENTYQLVRNHFECKFRGEIDVKNKGMMKMYYILGMKNSTQKDLKDTNKIVLC